MPARSTSELDSIGKIVGGKAAPREAGVDRVSLDGQVAYDIRWAGQGVRDVRDGMLKLAALLDSSKRLKRAVLVISLSRSTPGRVRNEWRAGLRVLRRDIARRLALMAVVERELVVLPAERRLVAVAKKLACASQAAPGNWPVAEKTRSALASWKQVEVEKVLLERWLRGAGAISIGALQATVGCSYPTVAAALAPLIAEGIVTRGEYRSVELVRYGRVKWSALAATAQRIYPPIEFVDVTGQQPSIEGLLRRLRRRDASLGDGIALGGVAAARHWDRRFDLNGTPRIDLVVHLPKGTASPAPGLDFVGKIDPALVQRSGANRHRSPVLVVHRIQRSLSGFDFGSRRQLPWADPVETIIHLLQMGLTTQAGEMVSRLRPEIAVAAEEK